MNRDQSSISGIPTYYSNVCDVFCTKYPISGFAEKTMETQLHQHTHPFLQQIHSKFLSIGKFSI